MYNTHISTRYAAEAILNPTGPPNSPPVNKNPDNLVFMLHTSAHIKMAEHLPSSASKWSKTDG